MEARGFEPRSENRSTTVSTCVSRRLRSPTTGQRAAHRRTSLLKFRPTPEGVTPDYPDIAIPAAPPRAGFNSGHEHNAYALRCERQFSVGDCVFSRVFCQGSRPGHATTASLSPSKPSRPRNEDCNLATRRTSDNRRIEISGEVKRASWCATAGCVERAKQECLDNACACLRT